MESDSSDDQTADESDDEGQISYFIELSSSSESSDEVSGKESIRGIFKFGKLTTSSKNSGKESEEFQVGKDQEEKSSEGIEGVKRQMLELLSNQTGETALQPSNTDSSVKFVGGFPGRDSFDSTEDLKEQEIDYIDIRDDSNIEADEKVDTAETVEEKETLRDNMNSSHMPPSYMEGLEGNADRGFPQETNDTDMTYQMDDFVSINESFVILGPQSTSAETVVVNNQIGETEKSFQEVTQIPSSEGFEEPFEIVVESFGDPDPIYENTGNIKGTPPNSKDTRITPLPIPGNPTKEAYMDLSQLSLAEVQKKSFILIMEDEALKKTEEEHYLLEVEHKPVVRQPLEINDSAKDSKDDTEQRHQKEIQVDNAEHDASSKKVSGLMKMFESNSDVSDEDKTGKNADDGLQNIKSSQDENESKTHVFALPLESKLVQKRHGNIVLKPYNRPLAEPKSVKQFSSEESQKERSEDENVSRTCVSELPLESTPVQKRRGNIVLKPYNQSLAEPKSVKQFKSEESQKERSQDENASQTRVSELPLDIVRQFQDRVGSSSHPATRKEEQKQGKGAISGHTKSEELATELGYTMVIGLNESTSDDNLWNFMEETSDASLKEIVYGPKRENAVVIFERKPDYNNLQMRVSKKTLDGKVLELFDMPPPTSIIMSIMEPKEFSTDTLTFHFESKKYGGAELVEDGIKITEDGCFIITFTQSDVQESLYDTPGIIVIIFSISINKAIERVCAIQHKVENIPLNVSPYYQCKKWAAWNTAIHGINIPAPFVHQVDPVLLKYLQSFSGAMKAMQMAMMEIHAGIELQENAVLVTCLLNPEVKGCRKLVTSWRKDAEGFISSTLQIEKISNLSDIWDDFMDIVKSMIGGKEIMLVEERFEDYIQLVGFIDEVKTTHGEVMEKKEKLERIRVVGEEIMPLNSAAKKRLLDREGIFKRLRAQFSDFDVYFEQSSDAVVLSGVPEDRQSASLQIHEELRKFEEPFVIDDSTEHFSQFIKEHAPRNYIIKEMETNGLIVDWDVSAEYDHVFVYCIPAEFAKHAATLMKEMVKETSIPLSESEQLYVTSEEWTIYQAETESKCDGLVHIVVTNDLKNVIWISMEGIHADLLEDLKDFIKKNTVV